MSAAPLANAAGWGGSRLESNVVLELMIDVVRANGRIAPRELQTLWATGDVLGLDAWWTERLLERPTQGYPCGFLGREARHVAYALCAWIALVDGVLDAAERRMLGAVQDRLGLEDGIVEGIEDIVWARLTARHVDHRTGLRELVSGVGRLARSA